MRVYLAGPMRGIEDYNFPAFDAARDRGKELGWDVISPADIDRESGIHESTDAELVDTLPMIREFVQRDSAAIASLRAEDGDAVAMLPGWENSTGARAEIFIAIWMGLKVLDATTFEPLRTVKTGPIRAAIRAYIERQ